MKQLSQQVIGLYVVELEAVWGPDRLNAYRSTGADDLDMLVTYFRNVALSRDLHLGLSAAEVSLRNGLHAALTNHASQSNWYDVIPLLPHEANAIREAKKTIQRGNKKVIPGRVVAELGFGFWTTLLSAGFGANGYGATIWSPDNAARVAEAFPYLEAVNQNRSHVHGRFNTIRLLRNRTNHHEPIWKGMTSQSGRHVALPVLDAHILEAIGWMSPRLRDSVIAYDRFPETLVQGEASQRQQILDFLGI